MPVGSHSAILRGYYANVYFAAIFLGREFHPRLVLLAGADVFHKYYLEGSLPRLGRRPVNSLLKFLELGFRSRLRRAWKLNRNLDPIAKLIANHPNHRLAPVRGGPSIAASCSAARIRRFAPRVTHPHASSGVLDDRGDGRKQSRIFLESRFRSDEIILHGHPPRARRRLPGNPGNNKARQCKDELPAATGNSNNTFRNCTSLPAGRTANTGRDRSSSPLRACLQSHLE